MAEDNETTAVKNTVTIEDIGPCKKKVAIEIPAEAIKQATDDQYKELGKEIVMPGFRKGRAPRRLLEKRFGKETAEQIKLKLLADASDSAIKDNELDMLGEPDIDHEKIEMPEDGPMKFDFEVEVRPEFELPELEGIPIERPKLEVTKEQIDSEVEQIRRYSGWWVCRKEGEAAQADDQLIADAVLKVEGTEEKEKLDNIEVYVRPTGFVGSVPVDKFDELMEGTKVGETKQASVEVPKTYFREEYRGKKVEVEITVRDIKHLEPAKMDEAFFSALGVENEASLRENIQTTLQTKLERQIRQGMAEQVHKYMLDNTDFDLPTNIVADYSTTLLKRQYANLISRGLARERLDEQMDQLKAGSETQAKEQLKTFFIMDKLAKKLEIEVSDEELNGQIAMLALQQRQRPEKLRQEMQRSGSLEQFRLQIREEKCVEKLLETAKITEVKPPAGEKKTPKKAKKTAKKKTEKKTTKKSTDAAVKSEKTPAQKKKKTTKKKTDK